MVKCTPMTEDEKTHIDNAMDEMQFSNRQKIARLERRKIDRQPTMSSMELGHIDNEIAYLKGRIEQETSIRVKLTCI